MRKILNLTARYLADPAATAGLNARQSAKLARALERAQTRLGWPRDETIDYILAAAVLRLRHARPTLYINNIGSSGSHWLNRMLTQSTGLMGAGEIYVPVKFLNGAIGATASSHRAVFLQAVYLAHLMTGRTDDAENHVSNTAHLTDPAPYVRQDIASLKILLVRDPVDIVLSRTLRKPEYRAYLGRATADDAAYLEDNIAVVDRFYRAVRPEDYDLVCRYEDMLADPVPILASIARLMGIDIEPMRLRRIAETRRDPREGPTDAGRVALLDTFRETATRGLAEVRGKLDYA